MHAGAPADPILKLAAQDLIEYTLLLAFVALVSAGLLIALGADVAAIWGVANSRLAQGAS